MFNVSTYYTPISVKENGGHTVGARGFGGVDLMEGSQDFFTGKTRDGMALVMSSVLLGKLEV